MGSIFNNDFLDFLSCLNNQEVEYVLVGGYSVILHGYSRTTGDLDILVRQTEENYNRLVKAFYQFGMPLFDMTLEAFLNKTNFDVFSFGRAPVSIDIMTQIKGADFNTLYQNAVYFDASDNIKVRTIHFNQLIEIKKSSGRHKDWNDIEKLEGK